MKHITEHYSVTVSKTVFSTDNVDVFCHANNLQAAVTILSIPNIRRNCWTRNERQDNVWSYGLLAGSSADAGLYTITQQSQVLRANSSELVLFKGCAVMLSYCPGIYIMYVSEKLSLFLFFLPLSYKIKAALAHAKCKFASTKSELE